MKNPLPVIFPTATRVVNAIRNVEPQQENSVVPRSDYPPPYAPPQNRPLPPELQSHPVMQALYQMMAAHTQQVMDHQDRRLRQLAELERDAPENLNIYITQSIDRSTHDNSMRVDSRRYTQVDSRHIEAKKRLHSDWGIFYIICGLVAFMVLGATFGWIKP